MQVRTCNFQVLAGDKAMTIRIQLEPEAEAFAQATANPPFLFGLGPEKGRVSVDEVQPGPVEKPQVDIEDITIPDGPSVEVSIRLLRPPNSSATLPAIVYIPGAGWVFGKCHSYDQLIRELAVGAEAAV